MLRGILFGCMGQKQRHVTYFLPAHRNNPFCFTALALLCNIDKSTLIRWRAIPQLRARAHVNGGRIRFEQSARDQVVAYVRHIAGKHGMPLPVHHSAGGGVENQYLVLGAPFSKRVVFRGYCRIVENMSDEIDGDALELF